MTNEDKESIKYDLGLKTQTFHKDISIEEENNSKLTYSQQSTYRQKINKKNNKAVKFFIEEQNNNIVKINQAIEFISDPEKYLEKTFQETQRQLHDEFMISKDFLNEFSGASDEKRKMLINQIKNGSQIDVDLINNFSKLADLSARAKKYTDFQTKEHMTKEYEKIFSDNECHNFDELQRIKGMELIEKHLSQKKFTDVDLQAKKYFLENLNTSIKDNFNNIKTSNDDNYDVFIENVYDNLINSYNTFNKEKEIINNASDINKLLINNRKIDSFMKLRSLNTEFKKNNFSIERLKNLTYQSLISVNEDNFTKMGSIKFSKKIQQMNDKDFLQYLEESIDKKNISNYISETLENINPDKDEIDKYVDIFDNRYKNYAKNIINPDYTQSEEYKKNFEEQNKQILSKELISEVISSNQKKDDLLKLNNDLTNLTEEIKENISTSVLNDEDIKDFSEAMNMHQFLDGTFDKETLNTQRSIIDNSIQDDTLKDIANKKLNKSRSSNSIEQDSNLVREKALFKIMNDLKGDYQVNNKGILKKVSILGKRMISSMDDINKFISCTETANAPMTSVQTKTSMADDCINKYTDSIMQKTLEEERKILQSANGLGGVNPFLFWSLLISELKIQHAKQTRKNVLKALTDSNHNIKDIESADSFNASSARTILSNTIINSDVFSSKVADKDLDIMEATLNKEHNATEITNLIKNLEMPIIDNDFYKSIIDEYDIEEPVTNKDLDLNSIISNLNMKGDSSDLDGNTNNSINVNNEDINDKNHLDLDGNTNNSINVNNEDINDKNHLDLDGNSSSFIKDKLLSDNVDYKGKNGRKRISIEYKLAILKRLWEEQRKLIKKNATAGLSLSGDDKEKYNKINKDRIAITYDLLLHMAENEREKGIEGSRLAIEVADELRKMTKEGIHDRDDERGLLNQVSKLQDILLADEDNKKVKKYLKDYNTLDIINYDGEDGSNILVTTLNSKSFLSNLTHTEDYTNIDTISNLEDINKIREQKGVNKLNINEVLDKADLHNIESKIFEDIKINNSPKNGKIHDMNSFVHPYIYKKDINSENSNRMMANAMPKNSNQYRPEANI